MATCRGIGYLACGPHDRRKLPRRRIKTPTAPKPNKARLVGSGTPIAARCALAGLMVITVPRGDGPIMCLHSNAACGSGWYLDAATGINDEGDIVGNGLLDGIPTGYPLTPTGDGSFGTSGVPEPASLALLALGSAAIWRRPGR